MCGRHTGKHYRYVAFRSAGSTPEQCFRALESSVRDCYGIIGASEVYLKRLTPPSLGKFLVVKTFHTSVCRLIASSALVSSPRMVPVATSATLKKLAKSVAEKQSELEKVTE